MKKILFLAALLIPTPSVAATSSAELEALAVALEKNTAGNSTLNSKLLSLIREPAKTLDGVTLPTTAAQYTSNVETALKLRPAKWLYNVREHYPPAAMNIRCSTTLSYWEATTPTGLRMEVWAFGLGNCPSVLSAAIARAWAWKLKRIGR
jgi:hypothetical protein